MKFDFQVIYPAICIVSMLITIGVNVGYSRRRLDEHEEKFKSVEKQQVRQDRRLDEHDRTIGKLQGSLRGSLGL